MTLNEIDFSEKICETPIVKCCFIKNIIRKDMLLKKFNGFYFEISRDFLNILDINHIKNSRVTAYETNEKWQRQPEVFQEISAIILSSNTSYVKMCF